MSSAFLQDCSKTLQIRVFFFLSVSLFEIHVENYKLTANQCAAKQLSGFCMPLCSARISLYTKRTNFTFTSFSLNVTHCMKFWSFLQISLKQSFEFEWIKSILLFVDYISLYFLLLDLWYTRGLAISSSACGDKNKYALFTDIINLKKWIVESILTRSDQL